MNRNSRSFKLVKLAQSEHKQVTRHSKPHSEGPDVNTMPASSSVLKDITNNNPSSDHSLLPTCNDLTSAIAILRNECQEAEKALELSEGGRKNELNENFGVDLEVVIASSGGSNVFNNVANEPNVLQYAGSQFDVEETLHHEVLEDEIALEIVTPISSPLRDENLVQEEDLVHEEDLNNANSSSSELQNNSEESSSDEEVVNSNRKRIKGTCNDPGTWKYNRLKKKREEGLKYMGRRGNTFNVNRRDRTLKNRCQCSKTTTKIQCFKVTEDDRTNIFQKIWKLRWPEKKLYIFGRVIKLETQRSRNRKVEGKSQRSTSYQYFLDKLTGERVRVCKTMFCNTVGISMRTISFWLTQENRPISEKETEVNADTPNPTNNIRTKERNLDMKQFFDSLPKLESHYCRKRTTKLYLEPVYMSKAHLYRVYTNDWCSTKNIVPLNIASFSVMFDKMNLSLFSPKKDECDTCVGYRTKNIDETIYQEHILRKDEARKQKEEDKNSENKVFTMDLQSVLLCPKSNVSALYYRTKLIVHNFTIFDLHSKDGYCYMWHEGEGELNANCFSSILCHFLDNEIIPRMETSQKIILFSDGCSAQNRNSVLSNALLNLAMKSQICIEQKYLEKGHTQMECDSMHATIERRLKGRTINVPADYVQVCETARFNPKPYIVNYLSHDFFKNYSELNFMKSIRPGYKPGDPTVTDLRVLKYNPDGSVLYKIKHSDNFEEIPNRHKKSITSFIADIPPLYKSALKIKKEKYEHLMFLKKTMHSDYHAFYDSLKHE